jgi:hypothetical protein
MATFQLYWQRKAMGLNSSVEYFRHNQATAVFTKNFKKHRTFGPVKYQILLDLVIFTRTKYIDR